MPRRLPLYFEANTGQVPAPVRFLSRGAGYAMYLTDDGAVLTLRPRAAALRREVAFYPKTGRQADAGRSGGAVVRMRFAGGRPGAITGVQPQPGQVHYLKGRAPARRTASAYGGVHYAAVYPGIDVLFHGRRDRLEYDFRIARGADPDDIRLAFDGVSDISIDRAGRLHLVTAGGEIIKQAPFAYQDIEGVRQVVEARYLITDRHRVGFAVAGYDESRPLVIDPVLNFASYFGGGADDKGLAVARSGNSVFIAGSTASSDFPATSGAFDSDCGNNDNCNPLSDNFTGTALDTGLWAASGTVTQDDEVTATTAATTNDQAGITLNDSLGDYFDLQISANNLVDEDDKFTGVEVQIGGDSFAWGASGSNDEFQLNVISGTASCSAATPLATNSEDLRVVRRGTTLRFYSRTNSGNAFVLQNTCTSVPAGTASINFSVTTQVDESRSAVFDDFSVEQVVGDSGDIFVMRLDNGGTTLNYATYIGGSSADEGLAIALDSQDNAYVTGATLSADFPVTAGGHDAACPDADSDNMCDDGRNAYVAKLASDGATLSYATYLSGCYDDAANGIAVDGSGNAYVAGFSFSAPEDVDTTASTAAACSDEFPQLPLSGALPLSDAFAGSTLDTNRWTAIGSVAQNGTLTATTTATTNDQAGVTAAHTPSGDFDVHVSVDNLTNEANKFTGIQVLIGADSYDWGVSGSAATYQLNVTSGSAACGAATPAATNSEDIRVARQGTTLRFYSRTGSGSPFTLQNTCTNVPTGAATLQLTVTNLGTSAKSAIFDDFTDNLGRGKIDGFVTKFNSAGTALLYSTVLSGSGADVPMDVALDSNDNAVVTGYTASIDFPLLSPVQGTHGNEADVNIGDAAIGGYAAKIANRYDAFVTKLNNNGDGLLFSTFLGGANYDYARGLALDGSDNVYVTGWTGSTDFPLAPGSPLQQNLGGSYDMFVSKLASDGSALTYSTFLGGTQTEAGQDIAVTAAGEAVIAGYSMSRDFPLTTPIQDSLDGSSDAVVAKLDAAGTGVDYATYLGGVNEDFATGVALDGSDNPYVVGYTISDDFPVSDDAIQGYGGEKDAFLAKLEEGDVDLAVTISDNGFETVDYNTDVTYTVSVANNGTVDAEGVVLIVDLTDASKQGDNAQQLGWQFVSATPGQGTCSESRRIVRCELGAMASGAVATADVVATAAVAGVTLTQTATVAAAATDVATGNNSATEDTTVKANRIVQSNCNKPAAVCSGVAAEPAGSFGLMTLLLLAMGLGLARRLRR